MSELGIVVPVFEEQENLPILCQELLRVFAAQDLRVILVDDGSHDGSADVIAKLCRDNRQISGLILEENYGQNSALLTGIEHCQARFIISFDADLEYCPDDLLPIFKLLESGQSIVNGYRVHRPTHRLHKLAQLLARRITGKQLLDPFCPVKGFRSQVKEVIGPSDPRLGFAGLALLSCDLEVAQSPVRWQGRHSGRSKYTWRKLAQRFLQLCLLSLTGRSSKPRVVIERVYD